jgi:hypothetical protein
VFRQRRIRWQRSEGRDQKTEDREYGIGKSECGRGKYSISDFELTIYIYPVKPIYFLFNWDHLNDINDHNDERLEWIKLNCHAINGIRYI